MGLVDIFCTIYLFSIYVLEWVITSFAIREPSWHGSDKKRKEDGRGGRVRLSFLDIVGEITHHHEPPKFTGRQAVAVFIVDHAGHALVHLIRHRIYRIGDDYDAYMAQASMMNEVEADKLEIYCDSEEIMEKLAGEIKKRNRW